MKPRPAITLRFNPNIILDALKERYPVLIYLVEQVDKMLYSAGTRLAAFVLHAAGTHLRSFPPPVRETVSVKTAKTLCKTMDEESVLVVLRSLDEGLNEHLTDSGRFFLDTLASAVAEGLHRGPAHDQDTGPLPN